MAQPIKRTLKTSKEEVMDQFPEALKGMNMKMWGCHKRLGLMSFRRRKAPMLYAHIVEKEEGTTHVSVGPGLSYLGERRQAKMPKSIIERLLDNLEDII